MLSLTSDCQLMPASLPRIPKNCEEGIRLVNDKLGKVIERFGEIICVHPYDKVVFPVMALFFTKDMPAIIVGPEALENEFIRSDFRGWNDVWKGMPRNQGAVAFLLGNKEKLLLQFSIESEETVVSVTAKVGPREFSVNLRVADFAHGPSCSRSLDRVLKNKKELIYLIHLHIFEKFPANFFRPGVMTSIVDDQVSSEDDLTSAGSSKDVFSGKNNSPRSHNLTDVGESTNDKQIKANKKRKVGTNSCQQFTEEFKDLLREIFPLCPPSSSTKKRKEQPKAKKEKEDNETAMPRESERADKEAIVEFDVNEDEVSLPEWVERGMKKHVFRDDHDKLAFFLHIPFLYKNYRVRCSGVQALIEFSMSPSSYLCSEDEHEKHGWTIEDNWTELDNQYMFCLVREDRQKVFLQCLRLDDDDTIAVYVHAAFLPEPIEFEIAVSSFVIEGQPQQPEEYDLTYKHEKMVGLSVYLKYSVMARLEFNASGCTSPW